MSFIANIATVNGEKIYLAVGGVTRDAEFKQVGEKQTKLTKWGMACGEKPDGSARYVDCTAWGRVAAGVASIRKGDTVACIGTIRSREYNEKTYYELVCDWANAMGTATAAAPEQAVAFSELADADDGELPF